jgi:hypothetical protein
VFVTRQLMGVTLSSVSVLSARPFVSTLPPPPSPLLPPTILRSNGCVMVMEWLLLLLLHLMRIFSSATRPFDDTRGCVNGLTKTT